MTDRPTGSQRGEVIMADAGGWISGPMLPAPIDAGPLEPYGERWQIDVYPAGLTVWTAVRRRGSEIRTVVAPDAGQLAAKLAAIEAEEEAQGGEVRPPQH